MKRWLEGTLHFYWDLGPLENWFVICHFIRFISSCSSSSKASFNSRIARELPPSERSFWTWRSCCCRSATARRSPRGKKGSAQFPKYLCHVVAISLFDLWRWQNKSNQSSHVSSLSPFCCQGHCSPTITPPAPRNFGPAVLRPDLAQLQGRLGHGPPSGNGQCCHSCIRSL